MWVVWSMLVSFAIVFALVGDGDYYDGMCAES